MQLVQGHPVVFGQKYLLHKKRESLVLPEKCWEPLYAACEVLVILIRTRALVKKKMPTAPLHRNNLQKYQ